MMNAGTVLLSSRSHGDARLECGCCADPARGASGRAVPCGWNGGLTLYDPKILQSGDDGGGNSGDGGGGEGGGGTGKGGAGGDGGGLSTGQK